MKKNLNYALILVFILAAIVFIKEKKEPESTKQILDQDVSKQKNSAIVHPNDVKQSDTHLSSIPQNSNPELPPDISKATKIFESNNVDDLPADLKAQLNAPPPPLPDDLRRQLEMPPQELPEDLKAQLTGPPPPLPDDIRDALKIPPREVTIDEVNGVPEGEGEL